MANTALASAPLQDLNREDQLVEWVRAFMPRLREASGDIDQLAQIPDDIAAEFHKAGVYKLTVPKVYGGLEASIDTWRRVVTEIGRGDAGAAWAVTLNTCCNWVAAGFYPRSVTDKVFGQPNQVAAGVFGARGMKARRENGGLFVEEATWFFNSGVPQAQWDLLGVPLLSGEAGGAGSAKIAYEHHNRPDDLAEAGVAVGAGVALVPISDVIKLNDWNPTGLRGSGSMNVAMKDVFIPDDHIVDLMAMTEHRHPLTFDSPLYRSAFAPVCVIILTFPVLGAGKAFLEEFMKGLPKRSIRLTPYDKQGEAPVTHIQLGTATAKLDAAEAIVTRACQEIDEWAARGEVMPPLDRARIIRDSSHADQLVWEAIDLLSQASGGTFSNRSSRLNRIWQDAKVGTLHPFITAASNYETYGRLLCGVTPPLMPV